jgi:hypothetical protein
MPLTDECHENVFQQGAAMLQRAEGWLGSSSVLAMMKGASAGLLAQLMVR